jgi:hypothetical protein
MPLEPYSCLNTQEIICQEGTTSGSFKRGDLVYTDSAGQIILGSAGKIFGIAMNDYTGTVSTELNVMLISPNDIYALPLNTTTAQTNVGTQGDITYTAGAQYVTVGTSVKEVAIVGLHPADAVGTSGGRVLVRFQPANYIAR